MPNVAPAPPIRLQFVDDDGAPLAYGKLHTYVGGTATAKATYKDSAGLVANSNPVVLDDAGRCQLYLASGAYNFTLTDSEDNSIWSEPNVSSLSLSTLVATRAELKALSPDTNVVVTTLGYSAANDGGGWSFFYDSTSTAADDGGLVVQPSTLPTTGRWIGLKADAELNVRVYGATCDGTTDDITELGLCDTYCAANSLDILVDAHMYFSTDPSLSSRVHLRPSAQLRWGSITPTIDVLIDEGDITQHFNCAVAYVPVTKLNSYYPEWFGENYATHPVTSAAVAARSGTKTIQMDDLELIGVRKLDVTAAGGEVNITISKNDTTGFDFQNSGGYMAYVVSGTEQFFLNSGAAFVTTIKHECEDGLQENSGAVDWFNVPTYADNAAAITGGLSVGRQYKTAAGELRIVV